MVALLLYRIFVVLATPFILGWLFIRKQKGKEDSIRFPERLGYRLPQRPEGRLLWLHGASVGECLSMMPLINRLLAEDKDINIMVTSGTVTSASLMAKRLPQRAFHVYVPVDMVGGVRRFVRHFRPNAVLWFESEFWPNILQEIRRHHVPLILLNGRISDRSFRRWQKALWIIRPLLGLFTLTFGQTKEDAHRLQVLGAHQAVCVGNLKCAAPPAPFDAIELERLMQAIGSRPCWVGGSTHPGEEAMMANVHQTLKKEFPDLLTISAPRHPERTDVIPTFTQAGLTVARRTNGDAITSETDVYFADTLGEMGLIYRLAPIVFVGGSLVPFGGQNMLEPMRLGRAVVIGPHAFNFREIVSTAKNQKALVEVADVTELIQILRTWLNQPTDRAEIGKRAEAQACAEMAVLERVTQVLREQGVIA